jgi:hypothetical protein
VKDFAPRGNPDFSEVGIGETSFSMPQGVPGIKLRGKKAISRKISFMQSRQNLLRDRYEFFAIRFHHTLLRQRRSRATVGPSIFFNIAETRSALL